MKSSFLFALLCTLTCSSCQNFKLPWQKATVNPDPYAVAGAGGQYQPYPGAGPTGANPNYAYPNYAPSGEQAQVTPANGSPSQNWNAPQEDWSNGGNTAGSTKKTTGKPSTTAATASKGGSYVVKRGDTLSGISRSNGTTVSKLMQVNGLKSTAIREGQTLRLR